MSLMMTLVLMLQLAAALTMIGLVLVQQGKGADMGAAFGSGSSGSLFGASGSANFLSRMTALCATVFFASTLALALMASAGMQRAPSGDGGTSVLDGAVPLPPLETGPASAIPGAGSVLAPVPVAPAEVPPSGNDAVDAIPGATPTAPAATGEVIEPHPGSEAATPIPAPEALEVAPEASGDAAAGAGQEAQ